MAATISASRGCRSCTVHPQVENVRRSGAPGGGASDPTARRGLCSAPAALIQPNYTMNTIFYKKNMAGPGRRPQIPPPGFLQPLDAHRRAGSPEGAA
ncbi:hypothetical protein GCM10010439_59900 [Actinocorallia aurantiaca]|uniref:Uncharacterized protein n=1 Tax=Actinocorallia aurantiaca TaxID=46204 RepID=A0ABN3ULU7_9ACTN